SPDVKLFAYSARLAAARAAAATGKEEDVKELETIVQELKTDLLDKLKDGLSKQRVGDVDAELEKFQKNAAASIKKTDAEMLKYTVDQDRTRKDDVLASIKPDAGDDNKLFKPAYDELSRAFGELKNLAEFKDPANPTVDVDDAGDKLKLKDRHH